MVVATEPRAQAPTLPRPEPVRLVACHACGHVGPLSDFTGEASYVGGGAYRWHAYCRAGVGHREGEARQ